MQEVQELWVPSLGQEDPWRRKWQPWKIPWTVEPGRLLSMGSQRVRHDGVTEHRHTQQTENPSHHVSAPMSPGRKGQNQDSNPELLLPRVLCTQIQVYNLLKARGKEAKFKLNL